MYPKIHMLKTIHVMAIVRDGASKEVRLNKMINMEL